MAAVTLLASACGSDGGAADPVDSIQAADVVAAADAPASDTTVDAVLADSVVDPPPPVCPPGTRWTAGAPAFVEVTEAWGLIGVTGTRLSVTDIDGDGFADVIVRHGAGPDDFAPGGERRRFLLRNLGAGGGFEDVTQTSGLLQGRADPGPDVGRPSEIVASGDVDNDGDLDIVTAKSVSDLSEPLLETTELMLNNGDGTFELGPEESAIRFAGQVSMPAGVSFADIDRDGNLDVWVAHTMAAGASWPLPDRVLLGDGAGVFVDNTPQLGINASAWTIPPVALNAAKGYSWAWSSAACDLNGDGTPELLASSYGRSPNHLWRATLDDAGALKYVNESVASGYAYDHRFDWSDNQSARCYCQDNPGAEDCDGIPPADLDCVQLKEAFGGQYRWNHSLDREAWRLGGNSGATVCADIDNDGHLDLMTHEIVHWDVGSSSDPSELMHNQGDPEVRFARPGSELTGLTRVDSEYGWDHGDMTGAVFDFDNDGWQDIYIGASDYQGNRGLLYHQAAPLSFERLEAADFFEHNRSHGVAIADFDRDGDLDVLVGHSRARCENAPDCYPTQQVRLFLNQMGGPESTSNWVQLRLEGAPGTNRSAIGARVQLTAGGQTQTQELDGGHGHYGAQRDLVVHFGLGVACEGEVSVRWPDAALTTQTFPVVAGQRYYVAQGAAPEAWEP